MLPAVHMFFPNNVALSLASTAPLGLNLSAANEMFH